MPKVDTATPIFNLLKNEPLTDSADGSPVTISSVLLNALYTPLPDDSATPGQSYRCHTLAGKIKAGGEVSFTAEDIAFLKGRLEKVSPPMIVGQAWDILDPPAA